MNPKEERATEKKTDRVAITVVGCLVGFVLLAAAVVVGVLAVVRSRGHAPAPGPTSANTVSSPLDAPQPPSGTARPSAEPPEPDPTASSTDPSAPSPSDSASATPAPSADPNSEPHIGFFGDLEMDRPIEAADLHAVDLGELYAQARAVALKVQPDAQFTGITAFETTHGKADFTGETRAVYKFESLTIDSTEPPGKDKTERAIDVTAQRGKLHGKRRTWPATTLTHGGGAMEPPACTSARAWTVAANSGVPNDAVAMLLYYDNTPFKPGGPWIWSFRVTGHDDYRRDIDGKTCAMVKSWAKPGSAPPTPTRF